MSYYEMLVKVPRKKMPSAVEALEDIGITEFSFRSAQPVVSKKASKEPGTTSESTSAQIRRAVLDSENPKNIRSLDLLKAFPDAKSVVSTVLSKMVEDKMLKRVGRGIYRMTAKDAGG